MSGLENTLFGVILGVIGLATVWFLYTATRWVKETNHQLQLVADGMTHLADVFEKSSEISSSLISLAAVNRRLISSTESMSAAVRIFTGLLVQPTTPGAEAVGEVRSFRSGTPPIPPRDEYEEYAKVSESALLEQSDEEMAELEKEEELRRQGIEVSAEKILMPSLDRVNLVDS